MRNNKTRGYTLIEVLVVFIIIGLLLAIAIPAINNVIKSQEESHYNYHEKITKEASRTYYDSFPDNFEQEAAVCHHIDYDKLIVNDLIKEEVISCDKNQDETLGGVIEVFKNGNELEIIPYLKCINTTTNEVIIDNKEEASANCKEEVEYFRIERLIAKYDNANGANYNGDWTNRNVYVEVVVNDPYMVGFKSFEYTIDNKKWETVSGIKHVIISKSTIGNIKIRAIDKANHETGNLMQPLKIDKEPPKCTTEGVTTQWTKTDQTIKGTCKDDLSGCTENTKTITKTFTETIDGNFSPGNIEDNAGNIITCGPTQVRIDKIPPTCTTDGGNDGWTNTNRSLTGICSDKGGSGCVGNVSKAFTEEINSTKEIPGQISDVAGNVVTCPTATVRIDKTAPTFNSLTNSSNENWTKENVTLLARYTDGASGLQKIEYYYGSGTIRSDVSQPTPGVTTAFTSEGLWSANRNSMVYYRATDRAGNVTPWSTGTAIKIDKIPPTITFSRNGGSVAQNPQCTIPTITDNQHGSGVNNDNNKYIWSFNSNATPNKSLTNGENICHYSAATGIKLVTRACDKAGNCASKVSEGFNVSAPEDTITYLGLSSCMVMEYHDGINPKTVYDIKLNAKSSPSGLKSIGFGLYGKPVRSGNPHSRNGVGHYIPDIIKGQQTVRLEITNITVTANVGTTKNFGSRYITCGFQQLS